MIPRLLHPVLDQEAPDLPHLLASHVRERVRLPRGFLGLIRQSTRDPLGGLHAAIRRDGS